MTRQRLHGLAALLLIAGGGLVIFTETVPPAIAGLACTVAAGPLVLPGWCRGRSK